MKRLSNKKIFQSLLGYKIQSARKMPKGFNSIIYKITDKNNNAFIAKKYIRYPNDTYRRLETEYRAFDFLWRHGIRSIPEPIIKSTSDDIGIYRFIEGKRYPKGSYATIDVLRIIRFWRRIHELSKQPSARELDRAKEACLSIAGGLSEVNKRLNELRSRVSFVGTELSSLYQLVRERIKNIAEEANLDPKKILPRRYQTLSPSDFGFHNSLRTHSGKLVFIDFEYFGWDDPAKMVADFFLHPKMNFPISMRAFFFNHISKEIPQDKTFSKRVAIMYLLQSVRWCLIMLNVHVRMRGDSKRLSLQRDKVRKFLYKTRTELDSRPFPLTLV